MAVPAWVSTTVHTGTAPTTTCTVTLGTTAANDILILQAVNGGANAALTVTGTYITTGGRSWTDGSTGGVIGAGGWTSGWGGCWWSRANANHTGQTVILGTATDSISAAVTRVSGVITSGIPYESTFSQATVAAGANCALASFDTVLPDDLVLYLVCVDDNILSTSPTMNAVAMGNLTTAASSGGADAHVAVANLRKAQAGATGSFSVTFGAGTNQGKRATAIGLMTATPGTVPDVGAALWVPPPRA